MTSDKLDYFGRDRNPIPEGFTIDHLCHSRDASCSGRYSCPHRKCCNPAHLEPVTMQENLRRRRFYEVPTNTKGR